MPDLCCACVAWGRRLGLALLVAIALATAGAEGVLATGPGENGVVEKSWTFDIPPQTLISALRSWSAVTGRDWGYLGDSLEGLRSPGVRGTLTGPQALDRLLAGTGLTYVVLPGGSISIVRAGVGNGLERLV